MLQADQLVGAVLLAVAVAVFSYYTVWVMVLVRARGRACMRKSIHHQPSTPHPHPSPPTNLTTHTHYIQPFIDPKDGAALHRLFPPRYYAIAGPTVLLAAFVGLVACFIGGTMLRTALANRAKQQQGQGQGKQKKS